MSLPTRASRTRRSRRSRIFSLTYRGSFPRHEWAMTHAFRSAAQVCHALMARAAWPCISTASRSTPPTARSEEHTSELQSLLRNSYAVFCLKKKTTHIHMHLLISVFHLYLHL